MTLANAESCRHYQARYCKLMPTELCIKVTKGEIYCKNWSNWRTKDAREFKESPRK